ncbi:MAG TPA: mechanosensitive ion channel family protein [Patescibacteria group bacterium]|nr:mechanosensitive ion channel family protein [Patescibacteria group bacterium]
MNNLNPESLAQIWRTAWVQGAVVFAVWVVGFLVVHGILMRWLRRIAARTSWTWDDLLIRALGPASRIAIVASGLVVSSRVLPLDPRWDHAFDIFLAGAVVFAIVLFVDNLARGLLDRMSETHPVLQGARGLVQGTLRGVIIGIGALIFLDSVGISIAPILASLGVGSLAVALALQDTLANLFAGFHLIADKPIEAGQFVRLQSGEEGTIARVGWRSTWITTPQNTTVVVPNTKLAGSVLTNFDLPGIETGFTIEVPVAIGSDLDRVEAATAEVARETLRTVEGATRQFEPAIRYLGFGETGLKLNVVLSSSGIKAAALVRHEFVKRLIERYRRDGILVPFPTRTLDVPLGLLRTLTPPASGAGRPAGFSGPTAEDRS